MGVAHLYMGVAHLYMGVAHLYMGVPALPRYHRMSTTRSFSRADVTSQGSWARSPTTATAARYTAAEGGGHEAGERQGRRA